MTKEVDACHILFIIAVHVAVMLITSALAVSIVSFSIIIKYSTVRVINVI